MVKEPGGDVNNITSREQHCTDENDWQNTKKIITGYTGLAKPRPKGIHGRKPNEAFLLRANLAVGLPGRRTVSRNHSVAR